MKTIPLATSIAAAAVAAALTTTAAGQTTAPTTRPDAATLRAYRLRIVDGPPGAARPAAGSSASLYVFGGPRQITVWSDHQGRAERAAYLGVVVTAVTDATLRDQLKLPHGVGLIVDTVEPDSPAAAAGVQVHDVLTKLDDQWAINEPQLGVLVRLHKAGDEVTLSLVRGGQPQQARAKLVEKQTFVSDVRWTPVPADGGVQAAFPFSRSVTASVDWNLGAATRPSAPAAGSAAVPPIPPVPPMPPMPPMPIALGEADNDPDVLIKDGDRTVKVTVVDGKRHLLASDAAGKAAFDGPIETAEQRHALPPDVAALLEKYKDQIDAVTDNGPGLRRRVVILQNDGR